MPTPFNLVVTKKNEPHFKGYMNPLLTQFVRYVFETYVPELQWKLRSSAKPPADSILPKSFEARILASRVAKFWNHYLTSYLLTDN